MQKRPENRCDFEASDNPALDDCLRGQTELTAVNSSAAAEIVMIDPAEIEVGGVRDRFELSIEDLKQSIEMDGQKVPVLVRRDAADPAMYSLIAGRRRLAACIELGLPVRAEVVAVDDNAALRLQLIENAVRNDLTFIERARLTVTLIDERGFGQSDLIAVLNCDKSEVSRLKAVGTVVSADVALWIGPARKVGRTRWLKLAELVKHKRTREKLQQRLSAVNRTQFKSDEARFEYAEKIAAEKRRSGPQGAVWKTPLVLPGSEKVVGVATVTATKFEVHMRGSDGGLNAWLAQNPETALDVLLDAYSRAIAEAETSSSVSLEAKVCSDHGE